MRDCPKGNGLLRKMQEEDVNEKDIYRIVTDLILAGGDTVIEHSNRFGHYLIVYCFQTAYSTQWTLYLLSKHRDVQEKLAGTSDSNYIKYIVREALRMYPVAPFLTRILPQDINLGGYIVPSNVSFI